MTTTTMETQFGEPDVYGQRHPIESPKLIEMRLRELDEDLESLSKKDSWTTAQEKCPPELIDHDFKLQFLRARKFQVKVRYEKYRKIPFTAIIGFCCGISYTQYKLYWFTLQNANVASRAFRPL